MEEKTILGILTTGYSELFFFFFKNDKKEQESGDRIEETLTFV